MKTRIGTVLVSTLAGFVAGSTIGAPAPAQAQPPIDRGRQLVGIAVDSNARTVYRAWSDGTVEYNPWTVAPAWNVVPAR